VNRKPALIAALVGVGVVLVMVVALILPKAGQVRAKQKDVQQAQQQQTVLQAQLDQLKAAAKDAPKDRKTLAQLKTQIPPTADLPGLIRSLNAVADKADVDFVSISPGQPTSAGSYSVVPVQLNVVGGFFAVDQYMYLLETLPRVSKVTTMSISGGPDGLPQLTITLTANFYTTDTSAGPGSIPGGEQPAAAPVAPQPSPGG